MEGHIPDIRIKSGRIHFPNGLQLDFIFGMVFNIDGNYFLELHFDESIDLERFYRENEDIFFNTEYSVVSTTDDGNEFKATRVFMKSFPFHKSMGDFYCNGYIQIKQISRIPNPTPQEDDSESVHFIIVEGLKMKFNSHSKFHDDRFGKNYKEPFKRDGTWDYSSISFQNEDLTNYQFIIYKKNDDQMVLEFQSENQFMDLTYSNWLELKLDFIEFLSFLNGAAVSIREEHFGNFWSPQSLSGEVSVYYSFEKKLPKRHNDYMAINNSWFRSERTLEKAFLFNFRIYRQKNQTWDLNTIIFYLNNAEQFESIGDKIFIQTILLERLSNTYADILDEEWLDYIPKDIFQELHKDLTLALNKHKSKIDNPKFRTLKGKIDELNKVKKKNNIIKFENLIEGVGIKLTDNIRQLLIKRHDIIHRGEIGQFNDALQDLELMDKLLRKIIINIIEYKGATIEDGKHYQTPPERLIFDIEN